MLKRPPGGGWAILIVAIVVAVFGGAYLWTAGSAVVVDEIGGLENAFVVTGDDRRQELRQLWSGFFYAIPRLEGAIRLRCRDGSTHEAGYVTRHLHTRIRIVGNTPCGRLER